MKGKFKLLLLALVLSTSPQLFSVNYISSAESIGWNGAYSSVADGFEAMLYNPAGIYMTDKRFGLNLFGSYGMRMYNNTFSTDDALDLYKILKSDDADITDLITRKLNQMPAFGMETGINLSSTTLMTYIKFNNFSIGVSLINKIEGSTTFSKSIFETVLQNLSLSSPIKTSIKSTLIGYSDFAVALSTRAKFLERVIPVEAIFVGATTHVYVPYLYANFDTDATFETSTPDADTGIYSYRTHITGVFTASGNIGVTQLAKLANVNSSTVNDALTGAGGFTYGFGMDLGVIVKFNRYIRVGLSATDIGFFVFPQSALASYDFDVTLNPTRFQDFTADFAEALASNISNEIDTSYTTQIFMPATALRTGVAFTPISNKGLDLIISADLSISDLNKLINEGYPTFNFATGLELTPKINWFEVPFRTAFSYNSEANVATLSFGSGLHFGPVELEYGIKGLEILITDWGAKEISMGIDMKFEF